MGMRTLIHGLFHRLAPGTEGDPSDDELLGAFLASRDHRAFEIIVRRHGPMVHGVCGRVLGNEADADDAFQAVFLVLVRKADSVRPRSMLGNWLHGVAMNVARKGRELAARRLQRTHESADRKPENVVPEPDSCLLASELKSVVDQELGRLPDAYRAAVVACDLEGQTRKEAAGRLGWSEGTVASRLARGRALLADRLTRRGVAVPAAGLAVVLAPSTSYAAMPSDAIKQLLTGSGSPVASELAQAVVLSMATSKLKLVVMALTTMVGIGGVGLAAAMALSDNPIDPPATEKEKPPVAARPAEEPKLHVLKNPAKDITILTDREEKFIEFFRRQKLMVGGLKPMELSDLLAATEPTDRLFVTTASYNETSDISTVYGAVVRIAPANLRAKSAPVAKPVAELLAPLMIAARTETLPIYLIFRPDAKEKDLWHVVGFTTRRSAAEIGFFVSEEKLAPDEFAPAGLIHDVKKKK